MLGLWTSEKGYQAPTEGGREGGRMGGREGGREGVREGGWEDGREGHQMPLAVDFPQVQLVTINRDDKHEMYVHPCTYFDSYHCCC